MNIVQLQRIRDKFEKCEAFVAKDPDELEAIRLCCKQVVIIISFFQQRFVEIEWAMDEYILMMIGLRTLGRP